MSYLYHWKHISVGNGIALLVLLFINCNRLASVLYPSQNACVFVECGGVAGFLRS